MSDLTYRLPDDPMDDEAHRELVKRAWERQTEAVEALVVSVVRQHGDEVKNLRLCQSTTGHVMQWWFEPHWFADTRNEVIDLLTDCQGYGTLGDRAEDLLARMKP